MRNGSRKLLINSPCSALRQMHSKLLTEMKEKETGKGGENKKKPARSKNSRLPCRCPDR
jgi:hypothetical protein